MIRRLILIIFALAPMTQSASACPMCKDSIASPENAPTAHASALPGGFNNSIYVMLAGLFLTIGFVGAGLFKAIRNADASVTPSRSSPESEGQSSGSSPDGTA